MINPNNKPTWPKNSFFFFSPWVPYSLSNFPHNQQTKEGLVCFLEKNSVIRKKFDWYKVSSVENCRNGEMIKVTCKNRQNKTFASVYPMGLQKRNINEHFNRTFHSLDKSCIKKKIIILNLRQLRSINENKEHSPPFYMISKSLFIKYQEPHFHSTGAACLIPPSFSGRQHCRDRQPFFQSPDVCACEWEPLKKGHERTKHT